jgi:hypothetical protein
MATKVTVTGLAYDAPKIPAIKQIRAVSGLGLKEAKYIADDADAGIATTFELAPSVTFAEATRALSEGQVYHKLDRTDEPAEGLTEAQVTLAFLRRLPYGIRCNTNVDDLIGLLEVVSG